MPPTKIYLALDVGDKRVGLAIANSVARLPSPAGVVERGGNFFDELKAKISQTKADVLIVGLPRNMSGEETAQTKYTKQFAAEIEKEIGLPVIFQDETLTSHQAEEEFKSRHEVYNKSQVDALAATYILEDYLKVLEAADEVQTRNA